MKPRERIQAALNRQAPDRCPMQISFTPEFADRLKADMALRGRALNLTRSGHNPHGGGNTYDLERALGVDLLQTSVGWANSYYQAGDTYTDEWGITWVSHPYETPFGTGHYTETTGRPLSDAAALDSYQPPDPNRPELYEDAARLLANYGGEYWIVGVTVCTIFETAWALRGYEQMLTDFITDPGLSERILDIPYQYHLTAAKKLVEMGVDMIWIGDDVGMQTGMLFAPRVWRKLLKPRMAEFIGTLKRINPALKVAYHSDGDIRPIIPDLIECGLDVLNPIQPMCMDPAELKRLYGDKLCFWGSIDEQETLPFGTPAPGARRGHDPAQHHRPGRRPDHRPDAPRPARHAAGELLGDGGHDYGDAVRGVGG